MHTEFIVKIWLLLGIFITVGISAISLMASQFKLKQKREELEKKQLQCAEDIYQQKRNQFIKEIRKHYPNINACLEQKNLMQLNDLYYTIIFTKAVNIKRLKEQSKNKFRAERYVRNGSGIPPVWYKRRM